MQKVYFLLIMVFLSKQISAQTKGMIPSGQKMPVGTERRLALVIGNKDYHHVSKLNNPLNDAEDMSDSLKRLGFEVMKVTNANYREFMEAINRFKQGMLSSDVIFLYYSGHGVSYAGQTYLLPIDADITCLDQIEYQGISLNRILGEINSKKVKNSFVILDACRNLPDLKICDNSKRDIFISKGLVRPTNNPRGGIVVYATKEGHTADDNKKGRNGLYTGVLLRYLTKPDWSIRKILDQTAKDVITASEEVQVPGHYDEILGDYYFLVTKPQNDNIVVDTQPGTYPTIPRVEIKYIPHAVGLKVSAAAVAVLSGVMAYGIKRDFDNKLAAFRSLDSSLPMRNGQLISDSDVAKWNSSYDDVKLASQKAGLLNALIAVSALSVTYEVYLLATKRKIKTYNKGFSLVPNSTGVALNYTF